MTRAAMVKGRYSRILFSPLNLRSMFSAVVIGSQCVKFTTMTRDGLGAVVCLKTQAVQIRDRHPTLEILVDQKRLLSAPVAYTQEIPDQPLDRTFIRLLSWRSWRCADQAQ